MYTRSGLRYDDCTPPEAKSWRAADAGQRRDLGSTVTCRSLYNLHVPSPDDLCFSAWTNPFASTTNRARVIFYHEGLLVGNVPCLRSLPAVVALPYRLNLK